MAAEGALIPSGWLVTAPQSDAAARRAPTYFIIVQHVLPNDGYDLLQTTNVLQEWTSIKGLNDEEARYIAERLTREDITQMAYRVRFRVDRWNSTNADISLVMTLPRFMMQYSEWKFALCTGMWTRVSSKTNGWPD